MNYKLTEYNKWGELTAPPSFSPTTFYKLLENKNLPPLKEGMEVECSLREKYLLKKKDKKDNPMFVQELYPEQIIIKYTFKGNKKSPEDFSKAVFGVSSGDFLFPDIVLQGKLTEEDETLRYSEGYIERLLTYTVQLPNGYDFEFYHFEKVPVIESQSIYNEYQSSLALQDDYIQSFFEKGIEAIDGFDKSLPIYEQYYKWLLVNKDEIKTIPYGLHLGLNNILNKIKKCVNFYKRVTHFETSNYQEIQKRSFDLKKYPEKTRVFKFLDIFKVIITLKNDSGIFYTTLDAETGIRFYFVSHIFTYNIEIIFLKDINEKIKNSLLKSLEKDTNGEFLRKKKIK